jgi:hypothetical protein
MLIAQPLVLLQRLLDDPLEFTRLYGIQSRRQHRRLVQDGVENGG